MLNSFKITRGGVAAIQASYLLFTNYQKSWPLDLFIGALKALYMCHHIDYVGGSCTLQKVFYVELKLLMNAAATLEMIDF